MKALAAWDGFKFLMANFSFGLISIKNDDWTEGLDEVFNLKNVENEMIDSNKEDQNPYQEGE